MKLNQEGSSMIDVLVSFAIMGIMIYATLHGTSATETQDGHQQQLTSAITLGERLMEELFLENTGGPNLAPGEHSRLYSFSGAQVLNNGVYTAKWTVTLDQPISEVSKIRVQVLWNENGVQREISLMNFRS